MLAMILRRFLGVCLCLRKLVAECLLAADIGGDIVRKKKGQPQLIWMQTGFGSSANEEGASVASALVYDHTFQLQTEPIDEARSICLSNTAWCLAGSGLSSYFFLTRFY